MARRNMAPRKPQLDKTATLYKYYICSPWTLVGGQFYEKASAFAACMYSVKRPLGAKRTLHRPKGTTTSVNTVCRSQGRLRWLAAKRMVFVQRLSTFPFQTRRDAECQGSEGFKALPRCNIYYSETLPFGSCSTPPSIYILLVTSLFLQTNILVPTRTALPPYLNPQFPTDLTALETYVPSNLQVIKLVVRDSYPNSTANDLKPPVCNI
jgi:hypothetical protein